MLYTSAGCIAVEKWAALFFYMWAALLYTSAGYIAVEKWDAFVIYMWAVLLYTSAGCIAVYNSGLHSIFSLYMFFGFCVLY